MAIKINGSRRDDRVERILREPKGYFAKAGQQARVEVQREMAQEQSVPEVGSPRRKRRPKVVGVSVHYCARSHPRRGRTQDLWATRSCEAGHGKPGRC